MTVYLLHFEKPIGNEQNSRAMAQHYIGFTDHLDDRIAKHRIGQSGAGLVRAFFEKGIGFEVARTWDKGREFERHLKLHRKNARRLCPICKQMSCETVMNVTFQECK